MSCTDGLQGWHSPAALCTTLGPGFSLLCHADPWNQGTPNWSQNGHCQPMFVVSTPLRRKNAYHLRINDDYPKCNPLNHGHLKPPNSSRRLHTCQQLIMLPIMPDHDPRWLIPNGPSIYKLQFKTSHSTKVAESAILTLVTKFHSRCNHWTTLRCPWPPARQSDIPQGAASCQPRARGFFFAGRGNVAQITSDGHWVRGKICMQFFLPKREVFVNFPSSPMWENDEKWQGMMNTMVSTSDIYCLTCRWSWALLGVASTWPVPILGQVAAGERIRPSWVAPTRRTWEAPAMVGG